jgi:hypothetical protein
MGKAFKGPKLILDRMGSFDVHAVAEAVPVRRRADSYLTPEELSRTQAALGLPHLADEEVNGILGRNFYRVAREGWLPKAGQ